MYSHSTLNTLFQLVVKKTFIVHYFAATQNPLPLLFQYHSSNYERQLPIIDPRICTLFLFLLSNIFHIITCCWC